MKRFFDWFNNLYPVWLVTLAVIAFFKPPVMLEFTSDWIFWSLAASMLGMLLTLSLEDFKAVGRMPGSVALGLISQYEAAHRMGRPRRLVRVFRQAIAFPLSSHHWTALRILGHARSEWHKQWLRAMAT